MSTHMLSLFLSFSLSLSLSLSLTHTLSLSHLLEQFSLKVLNFVVGRSQLFHGCCCSLSFLIYHLQLIKTTKKKTKQQNFIPLKCRRKRKRTAQSTNAWKQTHTHLCGELLFNLSASLPDAMDFFLNGHAHKKIVCWRGSVTLATKTMRYNNLVQFERLSELEISLCPNIMLNAGWSRINTLRKRSFTPRLWFHATFGGSIPLNA